MDNTKAPPANETDEQRDVRLNKDIAAFSYVWIMAPIIYVARKDSPFIRYHAKQGIVLFLLTIPAAMIPFFGTFLLLIIAAGMVLGFIHAAQGKHEDVPIVGDLAKGNLRMKDLAHAVAKLFEYAASLLKRSFTKSAVPTPPVATTPVTPQPSATKVDTPPTPPVQYP